MADIYINNVGNPSHISRFYPKGLEELIATRKNHKSEEKRKLNVAKQLIETNEDKHTIIMCNTL